MFVDQSAGFDFCEQLIEYFPHDRSGSEVEFAHYIIAVYSEVGNGEGLLLYIFQAFFEKFKSP